MEVNIRFVLIQGTNKTPIFGTLVKNDDEFKIDLSDAILPFEGEAQLVAEITTDTDKQMYFPMVYFADEKTLKIETPEGWSQPYIGRSWDSANNSYFR